MADTTCAYLGCALDVHTGKCINGHDGRKCTLCSSYLRNGTCPYHKNCEICSSPISWNMECQTCCDARCKICGTLLSKGECLGNHIGNGVGDDEDDGDEYDDDDGDGDNEDDGDEYDDDDGDGDDEGDGDGDGDEYDDDEFNDPPPFLSPFSGQWVSWPRRY